MTVATANQTSNMALCTVNNYEHGRRHCWSI